MCNDCTVGQLFHCQASRFVDSITCCTSLQSLPPQTEKATLAGEGDVKGTIVQHAVAPETDTGA